MILELDIGNSRIKWRMFDEQSGEPGEVAFAANHDELFKMLHGKVAPLMVRMCSVRGGDISDAIEVWVDGEWSLPVHIARVRSSCGGVHNQYKDQTRLGVDRWLAMLAAYQLAGGTCVIIDSGTALTVDVVDEQGLHLGGYILPGLQLMRLSLEQNTRIRLAPQTDANSLELGNSTESAVRNGTLAAQVSLINSVIKDVEAKSDKVRIFIAGGDAETLVAHSKATKFESAPTLVLDGLAIACPFI